MWIGRAKAAGNNLDLGMVVQIGTRPTIVLMVDLEWEIGKQCRRIDRKPTIHWGWQRRKLCLQPQIVKWLLGLVLFIMEF